LRRRIVPFSTPPPTIPVVDGLAFRVIAAMFTLPAAILVSAALIMLPGFLVGYREGMDRRGKDDTAA